MYVRHAQKIAKLFFSVRSTQFPFKLNILFIKKYTNLLGPKILRNWQFWQLKFFDDVRELTTYITVFIFKDLGRNFINYLLRSCYPNLFDLYNNNKLKQNKGTGSGYIRQRINASLPLPLPLPLQPVMAKCIHLHLPTYLLGIIASILIVERK